MINKKKIYNNNLIIYNNNYNHIKVIKNKSNKNY